MFYLWTFILEGGGGVSSTLVYRWNDVRRGWRIGGKWGGGLKIDVSKQASMNRIIRV